MKEFFIKYWLEAVFGVIVAVLGGCTAKLRKRVRRISSVERGMLALLHDRLYQACTYLLGRGYADADDKRNLEYMFVPYKELGGNGTCEAMYLQCLSLPINRKEG